MAADLLSVVTQQFLVVVVLAGRRHPTLQTTAPALDLLWAVSENY